MQEQLYYFKVLSTVQRNEPFKFYSGHEDYHDVVLSCGCTRPRLFRFLDKNQIHTSHINCNSKRLYYVFSLKANIYLEGYREEEFKKLKNVKHFVYSNFISDSKISIF